MEYDRQKQRTKLNVVFRVPSEAFKDRIRDAAGILGISMNNYILTAVREKMEREGENPMFPENDD